MQEPNRCGGSRSRHSSSRPSTSTRTTGSHGTQEAHRSDRAVRRHRLGGTCVTTSGMAIRRRQPATATCRSSAQGTRPCACASCWPTAERWAVGTGCALLAGGAARPLDYRSDDDRRRHPPLPAEPARVRPRRRSRRVRAGGQAGTHRRRPQHHDARGKPPRSGDRHRRARAAAGVRARALRADPAPAGGRRPLGARTGHRGSQGRGARLPGRPSDDGGAGRRDLERIAAIRPDGQAVFDSGAGRARSGAGRARTARRVVRGPRRRLTPAIPAMRITRATRLRPTDTPSAARSA